MLTFTASPRAIRLAQTIIPFLVFIWIINTFFIPHSKVRPQFRSRPLPTDQPRPAHPIDQLREQAGKDLDELIKKQTHTVTAAERSYIERRGRRPPPGFDKWFEFAQERDAVIVEEFFDGIYDDLNPFWAIPPNEIRQPASDFIHRISIRDHNVTTRSNHEREWMDVWGDLVRQIAYLLPDLDLPINVMDESRMVVPWENINGYMEKEAATRKVIAKEDMTTMFNGTIIPGGEAVPESEFGFEGMGLYWDHFVRGCAPNSPARKGFIAESKFETPPPLLRGQPSHSFNGYVKNWTQTKSACENPELQGLHGTFVEPLSLSTTRKFFPLFGGSKLSTNNEILLPPPMYWSDRALYSGGDVHGGDWSEKSTRVMWRGVASGGRNREENWTRFQRHRFIAMLNGTNVAKVEWQDHAPNFVLPDKDAYNLSFDQDYPLSQWLDEIVDAAFISLMCFPDEGVTCRYTNKWFFIAPSVPMAEQYNAKYLPDIDGNSFSGRYRSFLASTSLPIKATIYNEWHDARLMPWIHFVPMDNTFIDVYGILEYFVGTNSRLGHDDIAETIANDGKAWAEKVLRHEDMLIYVLRLLLEYARLCSDDRETLGWAS